MAMKVGSFEAKTRLSELLEKVRRGETVTITRHGTPVARLVPVDKHHTTDLEEVLKELSDIRGATKEGPESITQLLEEGRRL